MVVTTYKYLFLELARSNTDAELIA